MAADTPVKKARELRGISQRQLAIKAGISPSQMGSIERGEKKPSIDKAHRIARILRFTTWALWPLPEDAVRGGGSRSSAA